MCTSCRTILEALENTNRDGSIGILPFFNSILGKGEVGNVVLVAKFKKQTIVWELNCLIKVGLITNSNIIIVVIR